SPRRRVPKSTPLPGPSVTMNLTGRCGQVCAIDGGIASSNKRSVRPTAWRPTAAHRSVLDMDTSYIAYDIRAMYTCQTCPLHRRRFRNFRRPPARGDRSVRGAASYQRERAVMSDLSIVGTSRNLSSFRESSPVYPLSVLWRWSGAQP